MENSIDVIIGGRAYTLRGFESEEHIIRLAGYINQKIAQLRAVEGFTRQTQEYQTLLLELNMADDQQNAAAELEQLKKKNEELEKEIYSLKHQLVSAQLKLDEQAKDKAVHAQASRSERPRGGQRTGSNNKYSS